MRLTILFLIVAVFALGMLVAGVVYGVIPQDDPAPEASGCLANYAILLPDSINLAGRQLVKDTGMPRQTVRSAGLIESEGKQHYFIDGTDHLAIGELCWQGERSAPTPTFIEPLLIDKVSEPPKS